MVDYVIGGLASKARQTTESVGYNHYVLDDNVDPGYLSFWDSADETKSSGVGDLAWLVGPSGRYLYSAGRPGAYLCTLGELFEYGIGYVRRNASGNDVLYRDHILLSSNWNNEAVYWPSGSKVLTGDLPEHALKGNIVGYHRLSTFSTATGTSTLPYNNVKPVQTQGTQVGSDLTFTPQSAFSVIHIYGQVHMTTNNSTLTTFHALLWRKLNNVWTLVGLAPHSHTGSANEPHTFQFKFYDKPACAQELTYRLRVAVSAVDGGNWYINRRSSTSTPPFGSNRLNTNIFFFEHLCGIRGTSPFSPINSIGFWP